MLTARETKEDLTRALESGADDFVGKSSDLAVIKGRIRALLRRKFFQEENRRIHEELKTKELEAVRARAEKTAAEARATIAEGVMTRTTELKRSNEELEQFAYIASHDLQEPLRMVTNYLQLLRQRYKGKLDANADEFISFALDGAERMQALIVGLLSYSRVGKQSKPFEPVDCEQILARALTNLKVAIEESSAVIKHERLPVVQGDPVQLTQLFQNLIGNAIKFRGEQPSQVQIRIERKGPEWQFAIQDNGIGIPERAQSRIFDRFYQVADSLTRDHGGTGLGLTLVRELVGALGGAIWLRSREGQGSTFTFALPFHQNQAASAPTSASL